MGNDIVNIQLLTLSVNVLNKQVKMIKCHIFVIILLKIDNANIIV